MSVITNARILGYEVDKEVFDISIKNKNNNVTIENKDILNIDYNNLKVECFIITDPFHDEADLEYLIKKKFNNKYDSIVNLIGYIDNKSFKNTNLKNILKMST